MCMCSSAFASFRCQETLSLVVLSACPHPPQLAHRLGFVATAVNRSAAVLHLESRRMESLPFFLVGSSSSSTSCSPFFDFNSCSAVLSSSNLLLISVISSCRFACVWRILSIFCFNWITSPCNTTALDTLSETAVYFFHFAFMLNSLCLLLLGACVRHFRKGRTTKGKKLIILSGSDMMTRLETLQFPESKMKL